MTDHTDQDARKAREWAEYINSMPNIHGDYLLQARAAARFILDNTDSPLPDPLFLAKATHPECGEGVVASHHPSRSGQVRFMLPSEAFYDGTIYRWVDTSDLTFHTPDHPDHPGFLETEGDYRSAPEGTVVAQDEGKPFVLIDELWRITGHLGSNHDDMAGIRRRVLRWRWEDKTNTNNRDR